MARVAILTFSDGRDFVYRDLDGFVSEIEGSLASRLRARGHEVLRGEATVTSNELAFGEARRLSAARPDLTIFSIPVWSWPNFSMIAARQTPGAITLFSTVNPQYPGMVGMLAAAGALEQLGRSYGRVWGDISNPSVESAIDRQVLAAEAVASLNGSVFGRIGGRSMGMFTAVANTAEWMARFGVDVEEIDQLEIVRRAESVDAGRVTAARDWLERHAGGVHYDGAQLTRETLERQIRSYHAMRELIDEWNLDFSGIKGQPELTNHFATMDITEAFLNDPYDWEGPKPTHVCATEADMDGALTMQLLKTLGGGNPVLFADLRHYNERHDVWDLCNSGQHPTWFAARSDDPAENLRHVHLYPEGFYFPAGGASIHHLAAPGEFTFARLARDSAGYRMHVLRGELVQFEGELNEQLMRESTYEWPHAFARFEAAAGEILSRYLSNHIHAIPGDHVEALRGVCDLLAIDFDWFGGSA
jgi:L-fucose/D-arabinose isomerase